MTVPFCAFAWRRMWCSAASAASSVDKALAREAIGDTLKAIHHGPRQPGQPAVAAARNVWKREHE